jgi:hypothetical protein
LRPPGWRSRYPSNQQNNNAFGGGNSGGGNFSGGNSYDKNAKGAYAADGGDQQRYHDDDDAGPKASKALICTLDIEQYALNARDFNGNTWILDSGASSHMTGNKSYFSRLRTFDGNIKSATGSAKAIGIGTIEVEDSNNGRFEIQDVLYVPELTVNLISYGRLMDRGFEAISNQEQVTMHKPGILRVVFQRKKGMYVHDFRQAEMSTTAQNGSFVAISSSTTISVDNTAYSANMWHERLAHVNFDYIGAMHRKNSVLDLPRLGGRPKDRCIGCLEGKMQRKPFHIAPIRTNSPLQVIHADICGPFEVMSITKLRYTMLIPDDYTKFRHVYFLHSKDEAPAKLKEHVAKVELHFNGRGNHLVKALRTDKGGEFDNKEVKQYTITKGIQHQFTVPRTPQQDGTTEISNKIIIGRANSMMQAVDAPKYLWPYAVKAATYITNFLPNKGSHGDPDKTPYELWYGTKPSVAHLRVWGCLAYIHMHKDVRSGKLDKRAIPCMFVGYTETTKIYEFFDPSARKFYTSRDAVFYEDRRFQHPKKKSSQHKKDDNPSSGEQDNDDNDGEPPSFYDGMYPKHLRSRRPMFRTHQSGPPISSFGGNSSEPPKKDDPPPPEEDDSSDSDDAGPSEGPKLPRMLTELATDGVMTVPIDEPRRTRSTRNAVPGNVDNDLNTKLDDPSNFSDEIPHEMYGLLVNAGPTSMSLALSGKDAQHWKPAIDDELGNLESHQTWNIVDTPLPPEIKPITARMVLQEKLNADGKISRYKARLVAHGFKQVYGTHYNVAYAPLVTLATIRMMFTYAAIQDLEIEQMDVVGAFLESKLKEDVYITLPKGCISDEKGKIAIDVNSKQLVTVKLNKSIYGLKQSAFEWYDNIRNTMIENGFQGTQHEAGLFYKHFDEQRRILIVLVWVDDLSIIGIKGDVEEFKKFISGRYTMKDLGPISDYLGMKITRDRVNRTIQMDQSAYIGKFLHRFGMDQCHSAYTPMTDKYAELADVDENNDELADTKEYQEAIGSLNYAAICTRPDIAFAVGFLGRFASKPTKKQRMAVNRVFQYLKFTKNCKLSLGGSLSNPIEHGIITYADASFANENYKSTTGIMIFYEGSPVLWRSIKQRITAKSTADAEFTAIATGIDEALWLQRVHDDLRLNENEMGKPILVYNDNEVAIRNCNLEIHQPLSRHVGIRHSWIANEVALNRVNITYIPTADMKADGMTKALGRILHEKMSHELRIRLRDKNNPSANESPNAMKQLQPKIGSEGAFWANNADIGTALQMLFSLNSTKFLLTNLDQPLMIPVGGPE